MKRTPLKKQSKGKISTIKRRVWVLFSAYIRTRDCLRTTGCSSWGLCITCGKRYHFKLLQAGHFIAGRHNSNLFSEKGVHAQCYNCNINLRGNSLEYRRQVVKLYGEGADLELEEEASKITTFTVEGLLELEAELKEKIKELEV